MNILLQLIYAQVCVCMYAFYIWLFGQYSIYSVVVQVIKMIFVVTYWLFLVHNLMHMLWYSYAMICCF